MSRIWFSLATITLLFIVTPYSAALQRVESRQQGLGGWGPNGAYGSLFDPHSITMISGEIVDVETFVPFDGMQAGLLLRLQTSDDVVIVHVGPVWYLEHQELGLDPGMKITVRGSSIIFDGRPTLIAAELCHGQYVLRLRSSKGIPFWAGWRKK